MKPCWTKGDQLHHRIVVTKNDLAVFETGAVHELYSTFALARDAEWSGRLFVLDMKEEDEEGIGTRLDIQHVSPALLGSEVDFTATFEEISEKGEIMTSFEARVGERLIAKGIQGQRILKREKIDSIFRQLKG